MIGTETLTARKEHRCAYCGGTIEPGTRYRRWLHTDPAVTLVPVQAHVACDDIACAHYNEWHVGIDERWVSDAPLKLWADDQADLDAALEAAAERHDWPAEELERIRRWFPEEKR